MTDSRIELPTLGPIRKGNAINESKIEYVELNANPIQGCYHACKYCYARKIDLRFNKVDSEEEWHDPQFFINFFDKLEEELNNEKIDKNKEIFLSTMTDLYQPYAVRHGIGRKMIEMLQDYGATYRILTKSPSIVRDMDILSYPKGKVGLSITTDIKNDDMRREWEPNTVSIEKRLEALCTLDQANDIRLWVSAEPFLPRTTFDTYYRDILYYGGESLEEIVLGKMNYVAGIDNQFDWVKAVRITEYYRNLHKENIRFHYKKEFWNYLDKNEITPIHMGISPSTEFCYGNDVDEQKSLEEFF